MALKDDFQQAINTVIADSGKFNTFLNGNDTATYTTDDGTLVDSLQTTLRKVGEYVDLEIAGVTQAKDAAEAANNDAQQALQDVQQIASAGVPDGSIENRHIADNTIEAGKLASGVLGTSASKDVGVAAGQIPLLDADAKLEKSVLPSSGGPIGSIGFFPTLAAVPANYLIMDGSTFDETVYPDLYAALGNVNTLLDYRGYFPRFSDLGRGVDSGRQPGTFQADDYKSHAHRGRVPSDFRYVTSGSNKVMMGNFQPSESGTLTYPESSSYSGGSETRPKNVSVVGAIRAE